MDFMNRNGQAVQSGRVAPSGPATAAPNNVPPAHHHEDGKGGKFANRLWSNLPRWIRFANVILLFSVTVLAIAIASLLYTNNPSESKYVKTDKYQAVFLQNGQVYFGKIASVNSKTLNLGNIFYLNSQSQSQTDKTTTESDKFTLIKLGCELHGPYDQMVINRDQVTFWENLKDDGQVVKTIKEWNKQNPKGQTTCSSNTSSTNQSTTGSSTGTGSTTTGTGTSSTSTGTSSTTTNKNQ